jgi:hypothetical protein
MRKTSDNTNILNVRYALTDDRQAGWPLAEQKLLDFSKQHVDSRLGACLVNLAGNPTVSVPVKSETGSGFGMPKTFPVTSKGRSSMLQYLELEQVDNVLSSLNDIDPDEQLEINAAKRTIWNAAVKAKSDKQIRFHTINDSLGNEHVNYVSSSRFGAVSEIDLFRQTWQLAKIYDFGLRQVTVDEDKISLQLIQSKPTPDPTRQGGNIYGLIHVTLSETMSACEYLLGFYQDECQNGVLFGETQDLSFKAFRGAKMAAAAVLEVFFKIAETSGQNRADVLEQATKLEFTKDKLALLESLVSNNNVITGYRKIREKIEAKTGNENIAEVVNILTKAAHQTAGLTPYDSMRLERVAGELLTAVTR